MQNLILGQKVKLDQLCPSLLFDLNISCDINTEDEVDMTCFGLDKNGHLTDDQYFIFYNQLESPDGAISKSADCNVFSLNLNKLPDTIDKLVFTAAIDGDSTMRQLSKCALSFSTGNETFASCDLYGENFHEEKAIILVEIYKKDDIWRVSIIGKGFNDGLDALLDFFRDTPLEAATVVDATPIEIAPTEVRQPKATTPEKKCRKVAPSTKKIKNYYEPMVFYTGFEEQLKNFVNRLESIKHGITTEESTKTSLIMPLFQILGFDVFNPLEFSPEYTADIGTKKGEKVDYAILFNGEPLILIEAKAMNDDLGKHAPQLFRYFVATKAKFAILTNGVVYKFYTDLDNENVMDATPFLQLDLTDLNDADIIELAKFHKKNLNVSDILDSASELKYLSTIKSVLKDDFSNPSDDFVRYILSQGVYPGMKTQNIIEKFKPIIKKSITLYINDLVNDKIQNALKNDADMADILATTDDNTDAHAIVTTQGELDVFYAIKAILREQIDVARLSYKDTQSYFSIILDTKVTKWICRLFIKEKGSYILIADENQGSIKHPFTSPDDLFALKDALITRLNSLLIQ